MSSSLPGREGIKRERRVALQFDVFRRAPDKEKDNHCLTRDNGTPPIYEYSETLSAFPNAPCIQLTTQVSSWGYIKEGHGVASTGQMPR
jgi:hypothetical protein